MSDTCDVVLINDNPKYDVDGILKRAVDMMDASVRNFKQGKVSEPIDLDIFDKE